MLFRSSSEEGKMDGLGWVNANTISFDQKRFTESIRIPHMGWEDLEITDKSPLFINFNEVPRFYFLHSYHFDFINLDYINSFAYYGYRFPASFHNENIFGVQFHPEKSHVFGMQLLHNFSEF